MSVSPPRRRFLPPHSAWATAALWLLLNGLVHQTFLTADPLVIWSPSRYQVFQRSGTTGTISITGRIRLSGQGSDVEARFNGGAWQTIATQIAGQFSAVLSGQPQGQGLLEIRLKAVPTVAVTIPYVGIGDVFTVAGQSNAVGYAPHLQVYRHPSLRAGLYGGDYLWKELRDPIGDGSAQVDLVADNGVSSGGSVWLLLAGYIMADQNVPVAFVPAAKGSTSVSNWLPGPDPFDRATLYGSMAYRTRQVGGVKAVLWWQGENNIVEGTDRATYRQNLDTLADAVARDLHTKLMICKLQNSRGAASGAQAIINQAIDDTWRSNPNVVAGPDLGFLTTDDDWHILADDKLDLAAQAWWKALKAGLYD